MARKFIISKRNTSHLTKDKIYEVMDTDANDVNTNINYYHIKSDQGNIIKTSILNFYSLYEQREVLLKFIMDL
jgi:hypothetical protein